MRRVLCAVWLLEVQATCGDMETMLKHSETREVDVAPKCVIQRTARTIQIQLCSLGVQHP